MAFMQIKMNKYNDNVSINETTGELIEKPKFRSMWCNPYGIITQDLSNEFEDVYEELEPFAIDPKTGNFLNNSSVPKIVKTGKVNVHEKIQSFREDVDLYRILERFAYSEDNALLNARQCAYGDISNLPDDLNGFAQLVNMQLDKLTEMNPELAKLVIDDKATSEDIEKKANDILKQRIEASKVEADKTNGGAE